MKTIKIIWSVIIGIAFLAVSCEKVPSPGTGKNITDIGNIKKSLINSTNAFGFEFFKKVNDSESGNDTNILISPVSASIALAMAYNGADGTTKEAMGQTLKLNGLSVDEINNSYKALMELLSASGPDITTNIANSIWYRNTFYIIPDFLNVNTDYYNAEVTPLDFNDPDSKDIINNWVAQKTNDKITEIIDGIPPDAVMYLINAVYFKGIWKYEFDEDKTFESDFFMENGNTAPVSMMIQKGIYNYYSNDVFSALELPYGNEKYSMIILLPNENNKVNDVINYLDNDSWDLCMENFHAITDSMYIYIPKFKFRYEKTLNDILTDMGMGIAFSSDADFSKINPVAGLFISNVKQKTYIEVNEQGTEAAAVTSIEFGTTSAFENIFSVNRPFVAAIVEKSTGTILFIGKINKPVICG